MRQLFVARHPNNRTANDVLVFFGWLQQHSADLLPPGQGDPYQHLKVDLSGLYDSQT